MKPDVIAWLNSNLTDQDLADLMTARAKPVEPPPQPDPQPSQPPDRGGFVRVAGVKHEYSTISPFNADGKAMLLFHPGGAVGVHFSDGRFHRMLPSIVHHSAQPRWDRKEPTVFYFLVNNELRRFDIGKPWDTAAVSTVKKFSEYPNINGMGEADISQDGDHFALCSGRECFVYNFRQDRKTKVFTMPWAFNNLYLSPNNNLIVTGPDGVYIFDTKLRRLINAKGGGHMDVGRDSNGDEILVITNSNELPVTLAAFQNAIVKIRLADGKQTGLLSLDWDLAVHISLPDQKGWAMVSTFDPNKVTSDKPFGGEILQVSLDGPNKVKSLGKHGSRVPEGRTREERYDLQPKASVSHDGSRYCYDANGETVIGVL